MDCEVCGNPIFGRGIKVLIDEAELVVCGECASGATLVKPRARPAPLPSSMRKTPQVNRPQPQVHRRQPAPMVPEGGELVDDYGQLIRKARQAMQLSQEDLCRKIAEKVSVLQKIESGRFVPDDTLVRKLEHALKIQLFQEPSKAPPAEEKFSRRMELTLGDVAVMQKRRGEVEEAGERKQ